jgi:hypothetical protein
MAGAFMAFAFREFDPEIDVAIFENHSPVRIAMTATERS